jgi:hypothetical protein
MQHEVKPLTGGSVMFSLDATAKGVAQMIFIPDASSANKKWGCFPLKMDEEQLILLCNLE